MNINWIGIFFGIIGVIALAVYFREGYRRKHLRFASRKDISLAEIYDQYLVKTEVNREKFTELWNEIANTLELPPGKLRPTDSFSKGLSPEKGYEYDDQVYTLSYIAQQHAKELKIEQAKMDEIRTVFDYIVVLGISRPSTKS